MHHVTVPIQLNAGIEAVLFVRRREAQSKVISVVDLPTNIVKVATMNTCFIVGSKSRMSKRSFKNYVFKSISCNILPVQSASVYDEIIPLLTITPLMSIK